MASPSSTGHGRRPPSDRRPRLAVVAANLIRGLVVSPLECGDSSPLCPSPHVFPNCTASGPLAVSSLLARPGAFPLPREGEGLPAVACCLAKAGQGEGSSVRPATDRCHRRRGSFSKCRSIRVFFVAFLSILHAPTLPHNKINNTDNYSECLSELSQGRLPLPRFLTHRPCAPFLSRIHFGALSGRALPL